MPQIYLYYKSTLFGPTGSVYTGSDCWHRMPLSTTTTPTPSSSSSWVEVIDASGQVYYHNQTTNDTSWTKPVELSCPPRPHAPPAATFRPTPQQHVQQQLEPAAVALEMERGTVASPQDGIRAVASSQDGKNMVRCHLNENPNKLSREWHLVGFCLGTLFYFSIIYLVLGVVSNDCMLGGESCVVLGAVFLASVIVVLAPAVAWCRRYTCEESGVNGEVPLLSMLGCCICCPCATALHGKC